MPWDLFLRVRPRVMSSLSAAGAVRVRELCESGSCAGHGVDDGAHQRAALGAILVAVGGDHGLVDDPGRLGLGHARRLRTALPAPSLVGR